MKISLVFNEVCSFTGKEEECLINLVNDDGESLNVSRECLELGLRLLSVVNCDPLKTLVNSHTVSYVPNLNDSHTVMVGPVGSSPVPPVVTCAHGVANNVNALDASKSFVQRAPIRSPFDMGKAKIFLKELQSQQKTYLSENENKKDDGGISDIAIRISIKNLYKEINKETMFKVLNKLLKFDRERFDLLFEQSTKNYEANFQDEH